jgi:hypothetical protein
MFSFKYRTNTQILSVSHAVWSPMTPQKTSMIHRLEKNGRMLENFFGEKKIIE